MPKCSLRELIVRDLHEGCLMGHFKDRKTYEILIEHFFWPNIKHDIIRICANCIACKKVKYNSKPYWLYTLLPVPSESCINLSMDFILTLLRTKKVEIAALLL